jgi:hypothetical protein
MLLAKICSIYCITLLRVRLTGLNVLMKAKGYFGMLPYILQGASWK